jgi:hypothetical protein
MKTHFFSFITIFSLLLFSCSSGLDRTIFIPDEDNPELPAYTEWGYNSFGAVYEREVIYSTNYIVPCKIVYKDGALEFSLIGRYLGRTTTLTFSFPLSEVKTIEDLSALHNLQIDLTENCIVKLEDNNTPLTLEVLSGKLHFKRFQLLRVDEKLNRIILSGTFELRFLKNGRPESISDGRFDMGVTDNDFYSY